MNKGDRPCVKSAATLNREREQEEKANPEKRQRRLEDDDCKKINFFAGHTRATVSAGARATAGNFRNSSFVLLMPKLSQWTGLNILEFSVSEAGGGKDLTDSLMMQQKQRIREGVKQTGGSARKELRRGHCLEFRSSTIISTFLQRLVCLREYGFFFTRESGVASSTQQRIVTLCCCRMRG